MGQPSLGMWNRFARLPDLSLAFARRAAWTPEADMRKPSEEDRLVRRMTHLRTLLRHTADAEIVVALNEFIAETETKLITLKPDRMRKVTVH